jgi:hypothetical protein
MDMTINTHHCLFAPFSVLRPLYAKTLHSGNVANGLLGEQSNGIRLLNLTAALRAMRSQLQAGNRAMCANSPPSVSA